MFIIELLKIILLGIVEGITEWLPISSTGHMIIVEEFIQLNARESFKEMFFVVIQLGAILAVVFLYFYKLNPFSSRKTWREKKETFSIWAKVLVGVIPAAIFGLVFDDLLNEYLYNYQTVALMLILYGIIFIFIENRNSHKGKELRKFNQLTYGKAFLIGVFQVLALIPGTSRSGATIIGGIVLGASRSLATEFSFFLSIPVMFGASFLKLLKFGFVFSPMEIFTLLFGMWVAFLVSWITIRFLIEYIKNNNFKIFGKYRILLGIIVLVYFIFLDLKIVLF